MGLILCPECGARISSKARMCPQCGYFGDDPALSRCPSRLLERLFQLSMRSRLGFPKTIPTRH